MALACLTFTVRAAAAAVTAVAVLGGAAGPAVAGTAPASLPRGDDLEQDRGAERPDEQPGQERDRDRERERERDGDDRDSRGRVEVTIHPVGSHPGDTVDIRVDGCVSDHRATAHSEAFVAEVPLGRSGGALIGEARISSSIAPGSYAVDVSCDGDPRAGSGKVTVLGKGEPTKEGKPTAPVRAGGGGAAGDGEEDAGDTDHDALALPGGATAAGENTTGAGTTVAPFGVTLLAGGVLAAAAAVAARRRGDGPADDLR